MENNSIKKGHPKGIYLLFVTEMWERFSFYGMRALFILYLTKALFYDKAYSAEIYGSYTGLVYLTPLLGGYIADRYWGNRKSIIIGALVMAAGQFFMFLSGCFYENVNVATMIMIVGLLGLIVGNGFFKPNISSMVGQLYAEGDKRRDSAYTIFYMGINLGAFIAPIACGIVGETGHPGDFKWGFLLACIGMLVSLVIFITFKDRYLLTPEGDGIGLKPENKSKEKKENDKPKEAIVNSSLKKIILIWSIIELVLFVVFYFSFGKDIIGAIIFSLTISIPGFIISDPKLTKIEQNRIWVIYIVSFFVIFFWAAFEQAGASLTYFAEEQTDRRLFEWTVPASAFQSVNAVAIVIFAPLFAAAWGFLGRKGREPSSPYKQAIGLFLLAVGYLIIAFGVKGLAPGVKVSMMWLLGLYTVNTFGELCLSPIGLSLVNKLAPIRFASLLMGVWFISTATANKFAGTLSSYYPQPMIELSAVSTLEGENNLQLLGNDVNDASQTTTIDGKTFISFDKLKFSNIEDVSLRDELRYKLESKQIVKPKSFLGYNISSLYDFFMLFVIMAGLASIILFFISRKLVKMMHGVE